MAGLNGMFSRRHQTNEAHLEACATKEAQAEEQMSALMERQAAARNRTPQEQLARLDTMLGAGKGAVKERARLAAKIASAATAKKQQDHKVANAAKKNGKKG